MECLTTSTSTESISSPLCRSLSVSYSSSLSSCASSTTRRRRKLPDSKNTASSSTTRRVSFPQDPGKLVQNVVEIDLASKYSEEVRQQLWYNRNEYSFTKSSAKVVAKESERYGYSKHLDGSYNQTSFCPTTQNALSLWTINGDIRRGLERWANTHHGQIRKDDQYMYIQGILRTQRELQKNNTNNNSSKHGTIMDDEIIAWENAERLREVGHILSRKSRLFAQMMGEADSQAAKYEFESSSSSSHDKLINNDDRETSRGMGTSSKTLLSSSVHTHRQLSRRISTHSHQPLLPLGRNLGLSTRVNRVNKDLSPSSSQSNQLSPLVTESDKEDAFNNDTATNEAIPAATSSISSPCQHHPVIRGATPTGRINVKTSRTPPGRVPRMA